MVVHPAVKAVSFTGSTTVGKRIAGIAAPMLKKVSLELGGKNPTLVFADSDWRDQLDVLVRPAFQNSGQICLCGSRIMVERGIYNEFRDALVEQIGRASCRERVCQSVSLSGVAVPLKNKTENKKKTN